MFEHDPRRGDEHRWIKYNIANNRSNDTNGSIKSRREKEHELPLIILKLFFEYE